MKVKFPMFRLEVIPRSSFVDFYGFNTCHRPSGTYNEAFISIKLIYNISFAAETRRITRKIKGMNIIRRS